jgi:hypothetical protein
MLRRSFLFLPILFFLFLVPSVHAATGFVSSPLLLSPEAPRDGDTVTLSVLFHNDEDKPISGTVLFYDGETLLARRPVTIPAGDVSISAVTFEISSGIHKFSATISDLGEGVVLLETTVTLPPKLVTKKLGFGLGAQASGDGSASESAILQKVDKVEEAIVSVVPPAAREVVLNVAGSFDDWREATGEQFAKERDEVAAIIAAGEKIDTANAARKPGTKAIEKPATADNGPANEARRVFLGAIAFLFATPVAFYFGAVLVLYFIIRFIVRRIQAGRANRRMARKTEKIK